MSQETTLSASSPKITRTRITQHKKLSDSFIDPFQYVAINQLLIHIRLTRITILVIR